MLARLVAANHQIVQTQNKLKPDGLVLRFCILTRDSRSIFSVRVITISRGILFHTLCDLYINRAVLFFQLNFLPMRLCYPLVDVGISIMSELWAITILLLNSFSWHIRRVLNVHVPWVQRRIKNLRSLQCFKWRRWWLIVRSPNRNLPP